MHERAILWAQSERAIQFQRASRPNFPHSTFALGGARRDRTDDLLLAKQALSQLSYGPGCEHFALEDGGPGKT
jgi:hypothetical protein